MQQYYKRTKLLAGMSVYCNGTQHMAVQSAPPGFMNMVDFPCDCDGTPQSVRAAYFTCPVTGVLADANAPPN